jgi:dienelactone hydrolase
VLGFSLGGCAALEAARAGEELDLAVSVYGYLDSPEPDPDRGIRSDLLVIHGLRDRVVPLEDFLAFVSRAPKLPHPCGIVTWAQAGHGFCNPSCPPDPGRGILYDRDLHARTWEIVVRSLARTAGLPNLPQENRAAPLHR